MPVVDTVVPKGVPDRCPNDKQPCFGTTFRRYGKPTKHVRDVHVHSVRAQRWQCTTCGYVWRVYPQGITRRQQSLHLQALSVFYWLLGMSLGAVTDGLAALGCPLGRTTVHDNLQQSGTTARRKLRDRLRGKAKVRVVAADCTHVTEQGEDKVLIQATDAQTGVTLEITPVHAEDEHTVTRYIQRIAKLTGCQAIVTDDADVFSETESGLPDKAAAHAAGVLHQVCQQHVVPNTLTLLSEIAEQMENLPPQMQLAHGLSVAQAFDDLASLEDIILARAPGSQRQLDDLSLRYQSAPVPEKGRKASPWYRLRLLTLDLTEDWSRLTLTDVYRTATGERLVPPTNNVSERGIGLNIKERYRTMRGYKSTMSLRRYPALTAYLRENNGAECFSALFAD